MHAIPLEAELLLGLYYQARIRFGLPFSHLLASHECNERHGATDRCPRAGDACLWWFADGLLKQWNGVGVPSLCRGTLSFLARTGTGTLEHKGLICDLAR